MTSSSELRSRWLEQLLAAAVPSRMVTTKLLTARYRLADNVSNLFTQHGEDDDLARAEMYFWGSTRG